MMAATILVVGFIGMIEAMALGSAMMDNARRQTLAAQILNHELELLRLEDWGSTIANLPTSTTWNSGATYSIGSIVRYQGAAFICITGNSGHTPTDANYWSAYMTWDSTRAYKKTELVSYNGAWYRCIVANSSQTPTSATYWQAYSGPGVTTGSTAGAVFTITRMVNSIDTDSDGATDFQEVTAVVTWAVATSRTDTGGSQVTFTRTRSSSAWYGKYGLNLAYQRS